MSDVGELPVEIVEATEDAIPFIMSTWVMSYRQSRWIEAIPSNVYCGSQRQLAERLIANGIVKIARWTKHPEQYYGWICYNRSRMGLVVHYCYVKNNFRRKGIGKALLLATDYKRGEPFTATHYPRIADPVKGWLRKKLAITFDNYLLKDDDYAD